MLTLHSRRRLRKHFSEAYQWLCKRRKNHPASSDIWNFRRSWETHKDQVMNMFQDGTYHFDNQKKITLSDGDRIAIWSSRDALVLKVLTRMIQEMLKPFLSKSCYHIKGNGGLKGAVRDTMNQLPKCKFFCKTDVKSYYDSIDHYTLIMKLYEFIHDRKIIRYVWQFLNRCVEWGGLHQDFKRGIPRGSSLSPLLGTFYLLELDYKMDKLDVKYFRYMDDILILAPTRWKLKKAIRVLNQTLKALKLEKYPDKTLIGKVEGGFDFLGYSFKPGLLDVSGKTVDRFIERIAWLYEQNADSVSIGQYVLKWMQWVWAGFKMTNKSFALNSVYLQKTNRFFIFGSLDMQFIPSILR